MEQESDKIEPQKSCQITHDNVKRKGERAELAFMHKATSLGFRVSKPYGESERYDVIVDSGHRLWRVQVKCTSYLHHHGYKVNTRGNPRPHGLGAYTAEEIDMLAVQIVPIDVWYILPIEAVANRLGLHLYPTGCKKDCGLFEQYREAWHLMAEEETIPLAK